MKVFIAIASGIGVMLLSGLDAPATGSGPRVIDLRNVDVHRVYG